MYTLTLPNVFGTDCISAQLQGISQDFSVFCYFCSGTSPKRLEAGQVAKGDSDQVPNIIPAIRLPVW